MVQPSAASLNSMAEMVRKARPLYAECRSILNDLANESGMGIAAPLESSVDSSEGIPPTEHPVSLPQMHLKAEPD
jgi:hypothetical protein